MSDQQTQVRQEDELTLRDLILAFNKYWHEALRKWWLYGLAFLVIGGVLAFRAYTTPPTYQARVTYMLNEDDGNPFGGIGGVLGQFGLARGRAGRYNLDKITELAKSRRIVKEVMFSKVDGDYLINRLIAEYALDEDWAKDDPEMAGFRFTRDSVRLFTEPERAAAISIYYMLVGGEDQEGLMHSTYDDISSILSLSCETTNEQLSIDIVSEHFEQLKDFYIHQAIERQQQTYDLVKTKVDSIQNELVKSEVQLASFTDASTSMFLSVDKLKGERLRREILKLSAMQAEAVKNMEIAEFSLKSARPVIQELDLPFAPLEPVKPSLLKALIIGGLIACVLVTAYLVLRDVIRQAMQ